MVRIILYCIVLYCAILYYTVMYFICTLLYSMYIFQVKDRKTKARWADRGEFIPFQPPEEEGEALGSSIEYPRYSEDTGRYFVDRLYRN